jgi:hypothetical protein
MVCQKLLPGLATAPLSPAVTTTHEIWAYRPHPTPTSIEMQGFPAIFVIPLLSIPSLEEAEEPVPTSQSSSHRLRSNPGSLRHVCMGLHTGWPTCLHPTFHLVPHLLCIKRNFSTSCFVFTVYISIQALFLCLPSPT